MFQTAFHYLLMAVAALPLAGCGGSAPEPATPSPPAPKPALKSPPPAPPANMDRSYIHQQLQQIWKHYHQFQDKNGKPPANVDDLQLNRQAPKLLKSITDGDYVVLWDTSLTEFKGTPETTLLAYQKEAAVSRGEVIMADQSCRTMTAEELKKFLKDQGR